MYTMLLSNFPDISRYKQYNNLVENYDACMFIPYGPKCYLWFTNIEHDSTCVLIDLNKDKTFANTMKKNIRFNNDLTKGNGTLLYCVKNNQTNIIVEDILIYKGQYTNCTFKEKLQIFKTFFCKDYKQDYNNELNISLAWIRNNSNDENIHQKIPYDIFLIKYYSLKSSNCRVILTKNDNTKNKIRYTFIIKKTNKCELYELYILNKENKPILYDYALINDLGTSRKMKKTFDSIGDNQSEGNDVIVKCVYNKLFKGWTPEEIVHNKKVRISNVNELRKYPSNYF